jgi:hypothetical protein
LPTLKFTGDHQREFPGVGVFSPGEEKEFSQETAAALLASGYFTEQVPRAPRKETTRKEGDE